MRFTNTHAVKIIILGNRIRGGAKLPSLREFSPTLIAQKRDIAFILFCRKYC